jgi:hypothetical protein
MYIQTSTNNTWIRNKDDVSLKQFLLVHRSIATVMEKSSKRM